LPPPPLALLAQTASSLGRFSRSFRGPGSLLGTPRTLSGTRIQGTLCG
jgi:hypothetical protein